MERLRVGCQGPLRWSTTLSSEVNLPPHNYLQGLHWSKLHHVPPRFLGSRNLRSPPSVWVPYQIKPSSYQRERRVQPDLELQVEGLRSGGQDLEEDERWVLVLERRDLVLGFHLILCIN